MSQTRAAKGGECGVNGEFYEGGKFLPNTDRAKGKKARKIGTGKVEIGAYEWAVPPTADARPLFIGAVGAVFATKYGPARQHHTEVSDIALAYLRITRAELIERIKRHAEGERWM